MILRKLADAVAKQNWFTVVLEVLIVVVGIFVGLQVDGWNETRKDRNREIEYLQRIETELSQDIVEFETGVKLSARRRDYARLIIAALQYPDIVRRQPTEILRALVRAGFTYSPTISNHTFEEIKSAGELGVILDVKLRIAITQYYQQVRQYGQWNYMRELNQTEYFKRLGGITTPDHFQAFWVTRFGPDVSEEEAVEAFENLLTEPDFIEWLPMVIAMLTDAYSNYGAAKDTAENLKKKFCLSQVGFSRPRPRAVTRYGLVLNLGRTFPDRDRVADPAVVFGLLRVMP